MKRQNFLKSLGGISLLALIPNFSITKHLKTLTGNLKGKIIRNNDGTRLNVIGDIQTHKLVGSDTNNQIVEWVVELAADGMSVIWVVEQNPEKILAVSSSTCLIEGGRSTEQLDSQALLEPGRLHEVLLQDRKENPDAAS